MMNLYLHQDALGVIADLDFGEGNTPYRSANVEFVDIPVTGVVTVEGNELDIKVYLRDEMKTNTQLYRQGRLTIGASVNREEVDQIVLVMVLGIKAGCQYLDSLGMLEEAQALNEETSGVELVLMGGEPAARAVTGRARPDLLCTTLFGGTQMCRPYMDEIMEYNMAEMLPLEDKIALAEEGHEEMMGQLALLYLNGDDEVEADPEKAFYWFHKLAQTDDPTAQFNLALFYAKGHGVGRDFEQAAYWMDRAAQNGDADAPAAAEEYRKAVDHRAKAEAGDPQAQADLAAFLMKLGGSLDQAGPGKDYAECLIWAQKSADQNNGDGIWALALAYEHGRGVEKDVAKAVELYRRGAELGHAPSQHSLGCYYMRGDFLEQDQEEGYRLMRAAADQGYGLAIRSVGACFQFGNGVEDDMKEAIRWYELYLKDNHDPELERKVALFKTLEESGGFDEPELPVEENLPEGYMDIMDLFVEAEAYEQALYEQGVLPDAPHGDDAFPELPRIHLMAQQGDERAQRLVAGLDEIELL